MAFQTVSHSEAEAFLKCQRAWLYGYGWNLTKQSHGTALTRGTAGHKVLEVFYETVRRGMGPERGYEEAMAVLDNLESEGQTGDNPKDLTLRFMLDTYFANEPFVTQGYEVLAVEHELTVAVSDDLGIPMFIDLILCDPRGKIAVVDHKFQYDFLTGADIRVMPQIVKYIGSIRAEGLPADYAIYNQLRYRKQKTLTPDKVVRQAPFTPTPQRVVRTFTEQVQTAERIIEFKSLSKEQQAEQAARIGVKMICKSCSFKDLCGEDLEGGNIKTLIANEYTQKERRSFKPSQLPDEEAE